MSEPVESAVGAVGAAGLAESTRHVRASIPLFEAMDLQVVGLAPGTATVEAPAGPNGNHAGFMYAGALFSLGEVLGGLVCPVTWDAAGYVPVVADVRIRFRAPAHGTIRATATVAEAERVRVADELAAGAAKVRFPLEAVLTDPTGAVVATTEGSYVLLRMPGEG